MNTIDWSTAKALTLEKWREIQASLRQPDPLDLITEINAVCSLCEKAKEHARSHGTWLTCRYCLAFQQFGGCSDLRGHLSEAIARSDWEKAGDLVAQAIADLDALELPRQN